jgi:hypothetical protein
MGDNSNLKCIGQERILFILKKLARLHTLELRGNKLTTTDGFNLPNLKNLFLVRYSFWYVYNKCLFAVGLIVWFIWYGISVGFLIMSPKQSLGDIVFALRTLNTTVHSCQFDLQIFVTKYYISIIVDTVDLLSC